MAASSGGRAGAGARPLALPGAAAALHRSAASAAALQSALHSPPAARRLPPPLQAAEASGLSHDAAVLAEFKAMISAAGLALSPELAVAGDLDATLRRFLRARKGRLDAAFAMLQSECL